MKYTKHKNKNKNNNTLSNHTFLTSKNNNKLVLQGGRYVRTNDTINKQIKKTRTSLPLRTLDKLNKYGVVDIYTQDGGFISNLKFQHNLSKIKKIIKTLGKYQIKLTKFFDSYENETKTFKRLGDDKSKVINDKLRTKKTEIILKFVMNNMKDEQEFKTSNLQTDLETIDIKYIGIENTITELNNQIKKEQKKYEVFSKSFDKQSKLFNKVIKKFEMVKGFYTKQKVLKDQYAQIEGKTKLSSDDLKLKKKYLKNKPDIDYVLAYGEQNIEKHKSEKDNLSTILDKSKTYKEAYDNLNYNKYDEDISKWETKYKKIYEDIIGIDKKISYIQKKFYELNEYTEIIKRELNIIYKTINKSNQLDAINKILKIFKENEELLNSVKTVMKYIKIALIKENEINDIINVSSHSEAAFNSIENNLIKLKQDLLVDKERITDDIKDTTVSKSLVGGANINLNDYEKCEDFLNTNYEDIFEHLKKLNDNLKDDTKENRIFYKQDCESIHKIIKIYFNIYLFFLYYMKIRQDTDINVEIDNDKINNLEFDENEESLIKWFISINKIYETITNDKSNNTKTYEDLIENYKYYIDKYNNKENIEYIEKLDEFFDNVKEEIKLKYFEKIIANKTKTYFNMDNTDKKLKNLYYSFNKSEDSIVKEFKVFYGYVDVTKLKSKDYKIRNESDFFNKDFIHNDAKYNNNAFVLYSKANDNVYNLYSVYYKDGIKNVNIKHVDKYNDIKSKYDEFINFISDKINKIDYTGKDKDKKDKQDKDIDIFRKELNEANKSIVIDGADNTNMFCNYEKDINDLANKFKEAYNKIQSTPADQINSIVDASIIALKTKIISDWNLNLGIDITKTGGGTAKLDNTLLGLYCGEIKAAADPKPKEVKPSIFQDFLKNTIYPKFLMSIYNNIKYDETIKATTAADTTDKLDNDTKISHSIKNGNDYLILYEEDIVYIKTQIVNGNKDIINYIYDWLEKDDKIQTDYLSECIKNIKLNHKTSKLTDNTFDFDTNKLISSFPKNKLFIELCKDIEKQINKDNLFITLTNKNISKNTYEEKYSDTTPIDRIEKRYDDTNVNGPFEMSEEDKTIYKESEHKNNFISKTTKNITKEYKYSNYGKNPIFRIVCFNVNYWHTISKTPKDGVYTNPSYAIDFIENITNIDALCLLDYTLHSDDNPTASSASTAPTGTTGTTAPTAPSALTTSKPTSRGRGGRGGKGTRGGRGGRGTRGGISSGGYFIYNNDKRQIQYGGVDPDYMPRTVSNKFIKDQINKKLKLEMKIVTNDNNDYELLYDDILIGKALYNSKPNINTEIVIIEITDSHNFIEKIVQSKYKIGANEITLFFVNFKNNYDKLGTKIKNQKEKNEKLMNKINATGITNYVIMGNFNSNPTLNKDDFKVFETNNLIKLGKNNVTFITGDEYDLCYISKGFNSLYKIMNPDIIIQSGGISIHYPIYIDIVEKDMSSSTSSNGTSNAKSENENSTGDGKPLLSTFLNDTRNIPNLEKNKKVLVDRISQMINKIKTDLKPEKYTDITNNINIIGQNQIELKLIEKNLAPSSIKEYSKISIDYKWINDISKKEEINLTSTIKEVSKLISTIPKVKDLEQKSPTISREDILYIQTKLQDPSYTPTIDKDINLLKKLSSNNNNVKLMIEELGNTISQEKTQCAILEKLRLYANNQLFNEAYLNLPSKKSCGEVMKKKQDDKKGDKKQQQSS